jgi:L-ascorbate metabolism protein UlaG (beta-lactamase superfamily)
MDEQSKTPAAGDAVFLGPETKIEPLVCGWYAWTHLISPLQHAMNVAYRHIPLLKSFLANPQVHVAASQDPSLFGGPFVNLSHDQVPLVRQLLLDTQQRCARLVALAEDLKKLDVRLQEVGRGYSLHEMYSRPSDSLSGLVEFLYDLNCHPKLRVYEELLYDEDFCADTYEVMLTSTAEGERPFFMSTPRLKAAGNMIFRMHPADRRVDRLASMRTTPGSFTEIVGQCAIPEGQLAEFRRFFTDTPPARNACGYSGEGVRVRYFGHACVLLQTDCTSILVDPMLAWDVDKGDGRLTFNDLPERLDYVVLSHNHQDHCSPEMLLQLRHRLGRVIVPRNNSGCIADPSMKLLLQHLGIHDVVELSPFEDIRFRDGRITSLPFPGEHVDLDIHARHGIHIEAKGRRFAFLVDSDGWDSGLFARITRRIGAQLDALFIGMECHGAPLTWLYGPLLTKTISRRDDESRRLSGLNDERAWAVVQKFSASRVFVYAMGQEPWLRYIMGLQYTSDSIQLKEVASFLERCRQAQIAAESLYISREMEF